MTYPHLDRRALLKGGLGLAAGLFALPGLPAARPAVGDKKLLVLFLRGGNDALNTIIPQGDADYQDPSVRPTLRIPSGASLDLGNGYAHLHPSLAKLKEVHDTGGLASIQRVGYANPSLSHFSSQQFWETAKPGDLNFQDGFLARWAGHSHPSEEFAAISVSRTPQRLMVGNHVVPHVQGVAGPNDALLSSLLGTAPTGGSDGSGLLGVYSTAADAKPYDDLVRDTGILTADIKAMLDGLPPSTPPAGYYPATGADLATEGLPAASWSIDFFQKLQTAVRLLKDSPCRVAAVQMIGFDDHQNQGALAGNHPDHLAVLGHGVRSVMYDTLGSIWNDLVVLVVSEFGRTSRENDSLGTDHGAAGAAFAAGGSVLGGVYNCDPTTWPSGGTLFSSNGKYVAHRTDYRAVYAEILQKHLGATPADLNVILPGWTSLSGPPYTQLGFL